MTDGGRGQTPLEGSRPGEKIIPLFHNSGGIEDPPLVSGVPRGGDLWRYTPHGTVNNTAPALGMSSSCERW